MHDFDSLEKTIYELSFRWSDVFCRKKKSVRKLSGFWSHLGGIRIFDTQLFVSPIHTSSSYRIWNVTKRIWQFVDELFVSSKIDGNEPRNSSKSLTTLETKISVQFKFRKGVDLDFDDSPKSIFHKSNYF